MTEQSLKLLHEAYNEALRRSTNVLEIVNNLYKIVDEEMDFPESDMPIIDAFIDGLRGCIRTREKTFQITNLAIYINITLMYIILWMNSFNMGNNKIDVSLNARRKGLESELTKLLRKAKNEELSSYIVRDRFGLRLILWNNEPEEKNVEILREIMKEIDGILCAKNRKARKVFLEWLDGNTKIGILDKKIVKYILLNVPIGIEALKDYVSKPKCNNYQTIQFTLTVQMYSELLPGTQLEVQLRTRKMHEEAEYGKASHAIYKEDEEKELAEVFKVDDFSLINIPGFIGYESREQDVDGIHWSKGFFDRRLSSTLIPEN